MYGGFCHQSLVSLTLIIIFHNYIITEDFVLQVYSSFSPAAQYIYTYLSFVSVFSALVLSLSDSWYMDDTRMLS